MDNQTHKQYFEQNIRSFIHSLSEKISDTHGNWSVKGFIDIHQNIYTISADTKIISKILEIHLFPLLAKFAEENEYRIVLAEHQNYYPDISLISVRDERIRFALDIKTTYRNPDKPHLCNGFTLGSHGAYFIQRDSTKNIQFPYNSYLGHYCLWIIYDRTSLQNIDETKIFAINELNEIQSVISHFQFFVAEKWKIASDKSGSGNTANIGSIKNIQDLIDEKGMFSQLGEDWFDDYWINYKKIQIVNNGQVHIINNLKDFVLDRQGDVNLIIPQNNQGEYE